MRALLSFQDLYVGLTPYQAPAVFSLLQVRRCSLLAPSHSVVVLSYAA